VAAFRLGRPAHAYLSERSRYPARGIRSIHFRQIDARTLRPQSDDSADRISILSLGCNSSLNRLPQRTQIPYVRSTSEYPFRSQRKTKHPDHS
jgi:hypothetical protein